MPSIETSSTRDSSTTVSSGAVLSSAVAIGTPLVGDTDVPTLNGTRCQFQDHPSDRPVTPTRPDGAHDAASAVVHRRSPGRVAAIAVMASTQATPPVSAASSGVLAPATSPARVLPSAGPPAPTAYSAEPARPRCESGVSSCTTVPRAITERVSAAPATARQASVAA